MSDSSWRRRPNGDLNSLAVCNCDVSLPVISDLGLTHRQHLILLLTRGISKALISKDVEAWDEIISMAEDHSGLVEGRRIAGACIRLMLAVQKERRGVYQFRPICCRHITLDECVLLDVVKAYQSRPDQYHREELDILLNGATPDRTAACASELGMLGYMRAAPVPSMPDTPSMPRYLH